MANERSRNFCLITYLTEEAIKAVLFLNKKRIRHYAYIKHDKDTKDDGSPQEVHYHLLLNLQCGMTLSAVRSLFPKEQNTLGQIMRDKVDCFVYLDHSDLEGKYHYPHKDIISDDLSYWEEAVERGGDENEKLMCLLTDLACHARLSDIARRYGRDAVIHLEAYKAFAFAMADEERRYKQAEAKRARKPVVEDAQQADMDLFDYVDENGEVVE